MNTQQKDVFEELNFANMMGATMQYTDDGTILNFSMNFDDLIAGTHPDISECFENETLGSFRSSDEDNSVRETVVPNDDSALASNEEQASSTSTSDSPSDTISLVPSVSGKTQEPAEQGKVSKVLKQLFKSKFEKTDASKDSLRVKVRDEVLWLNLPHVKDVVRLTSRLEHLRITLMREITACSYIMDYPAESYTAEAIERRMKQETVWITKLKTKTKLKSYMERKAAVAWMILTLQDMHRSIISIVTDESRSQMDENQSIIIKQSERDSQLVGVDKLPMSKPVVGDFKPSRVSAEVFLNLRELMFREKTSNPLHRIVLANVLDQKDYSNLIADPSEFMMCLVRYTLMPPDEFGQLMFCTGVDGKACQPQCPCGRKTEKLSYGYSLHQEECRFKDFCNKRLPHMISDGVFADRHFKILSNNEKEYILSIVKARLPKLQWRDTVYGKVLEQHEAGQHTKVIEQQTDPSKQHRAQCAARSNCSECRRDKMERARRH